MEKSAQLAHFHHNYSKGSLQSKIPPSLFLKDLTAHFNSHTFNNRLTSKCHLRAGSVAGCPNTENVTAHAWDCRHPGQQILLWRWVFFRSWLLGVGSQAPAQGSNPSPQRKESVPLAHQEVPDLCS